MFSSTQNSTQEPPGTLWENSLHLFLIWSVGCYECHQKTLLVHVHIPFRLSSKHHETKNFSSSQVVIYLEMFVVVPSASHDTIWQLRIVQSLIIQRWWILSNAANGKCHQFFDPITNISRDPQKSGDAQETKECKLCSHQLQIQHKKNQIASRYFASAPCIIQITEKYHALLQYHDSHGSPVLMNDGSL